MLGCRKITALCLGLICLLWSGWADAGNVRIPVWDDKFYPADRKELIQTIAELTTQAQKTDVQIPAHKTLRALILPHAGYIYSGLTAAHASHVLKPGTHARVILMGPDHRVGFENGAISDVTSYETPLGTVALSADAARLRQESDLFRSYRDSDWSEHSLEVVLPFLQYYMHDFEFIPIVLGPGDARAIAQPIAALINPDTLVVVSSDLSHYLPYSKAVARDQETIQLILNLQTDALRERKDCACGKIPLLVLMHLARQFDWEPVRLHYANSGDTAGSKSSVVGYTAIAFFGPPIRFSQKQGKMLLRLARQTLEQRIDPIKSRRQDPALAAPPADTCFKARCGTFVTLKKKGRLRGCIGNLLPNGTVWDGVQQNTINAALNDPRFAPLKITELDQVTISISILSAPQPLMYSDSDDLLNKLQVDVDGVIIQKGAAQATFLPQVWAQLPDPEQFLGHLCLKAGLPQAAWRQADLNVYTYQAQYFDEPK
jgi:AmmeMemoRadiSam system protein B/AmmeMemoRadiSam system protein A